MSGLGFIDQDCYPHWSQDLERSGGCRGVRGCLSFTVQTRFMVLSLFFFLNVKAKGKIKISCWVLGFPWNPLVLPQAQFSFWLLSIFWKKEKIWGFFYELMDSLRTVSKQAATLCVIQKSAESIFVVFLKGKNIILLKRQKWLFPSIIIGKEVVKERLILKLKLEAWSQFGLARRCRRPFNSIWSGGESRVRILYHSKCSNNY